MCTDFNSSTCVNVYSKCIYVFFIKILFSSLNTMLVVDKHYCDVCCCCDEFPVPYIDCKSKEVKNSNMENLICNQYGEKLAILNTKISKFADE